jgi:threonine/homoserine/homoserine lactone efflux protein
MFILPEVPAMNTLSILALVAALFLLAAAVPGPNWIVITRHALAGDRRRAVQAAIGVTMGSTTWMLTAMTGAVAALTHLHALSVALRLAGAAYLVLSAIRAWRSATPPTGEAAEAGRVSRSSERALVGGLLTSLTNPKSALFWTSVFTSTLPANAPALLYVGVALLVTSLAAMWYVGLALAFSSWRLQPFVGRFRQSIQRAAALIQLGLGFRLAISANDA